MKQIRNHIVFFVLIIQIFALHATNVIPDNASHNLLDNNPTMPSLVQNNLSFHANWASWTFSGIVTNESGEQYDYFFQIQRKNTHFHGIAAIINAQNKAVLIYEDANTLIETPEPVHWQVGNLFLRFNPINDSWVFGVKNKDKKGFNFKVDMLGIPDTQLSKQQTLRTGIELLINQTGRLNGHFQADDISKEQFVTAKKAWFRQIWVSKPQVSKHPVTSVLCDFNNGMAFYSVTIPEIDTLQGAVAGWRDTQGMSVSMSQFVSTQKKNEQDDWLIRVSSPKASLSFHNLLQELRKDQELILGISTGVMPGFCAINQDEIEE